MSSSRSRAHKKNTTLIAAAALALGGGTLVAVNFSANAAQDNSASARTKSASAQTVNCPSVADKLPAIPDQAKAEVQRNLSLLDQQIQHADERIASTVGQGGPNFVQNAILGPLKSKRVATIDRIAIAIGRHAAKPTGLDSLATCTLNSAGAGSGQGSGSSASGVTRVAGPTDADFVDITKVAPNVKKRPRNQRNASTGVFLSRCGVNKKAQRNTDNIIISPGVHNGAHHTHDYVGNKNVTAFTSDRQLASNGTTCTNGDQSTYYWPVLRDLTQAGADADQLGGGAEGNVGKIIVPTTVTIKYVGSPTGKVRAMPRFLRITTGDAKAVERGTANANAHWSCTGFEHKVQLTDKYPLCPAGSKVVRTFAFQNCWDGKNIDSADHRSQVAFMNANGKCPSGFVAIPQLTMRLTYKVPSGPNFAVDGFASQGHKAITDHNDFINVMNNRLMAKAVNCINRGRRCA